MMRLGNSEGLLLVLSANHFRYNLNYDLLFEQLLISTCRICFDVNLAKHFTLHSPANLQVQALQFELVTSNI